MPTKTAIPDPYADLTETVLSYDRQYSLLELLNTEKRIVDDFNRSLYSLKENLRKIRNGEEDEKIITQARQDNKDIKALSKDLLKTRQIMLAYFS